MDMIRKGFSKPTKRIEILKEQILSASPRVETDRALLITRSFKETEGMPTVIRRAKALEKILTEMPVVIRDEELIVGSMTKRPRSVQIFPEFSNKWLKEEQDRIDKREGDAFEITEQDKKDLEEVYEYWNGKTTNELATSYMEDEALEAIEANIFDIGNYYFNGVGHITVDYGKVLEVGFNGIKEDVKREIEKVSIEDPEYIRKKQFWDAVIISCDAVIAFAKRYAKLAREMSENCTDARRKRELLVIAENCENVPANGARTFHEACQSFWFVQMIIQLESNGHSISPGRFDQYMYPYYKKDLDSGKITKVEAQELVDCVWIKLNDVNKIRDEISTKAFAGYPAFQNLIVGGQTSEGKDATNDLSYMCLEATAHVRLFQPSLSVRIWDKTPDEFIYRAAELTSLGMGVPAYYNDEVIIPALVNRGLTLEDARDYSIIGCVEPQKPGKTEGWHDAAFFNMARIIELVINNGEDKGKQIGPKTGDFTKFKNFDEVVEAYKNQVKHFVSLMVNAINSVDIAHAERAPLPFLSSMVENCLYEGRTLQEGGAVYNFSGPQGVGVANVGDSLAAIKKLVFEEKMITPAELKKALECNFGHSLEECCNKTNNAEDAAYDIIAAAVKRVLYENNQISEEEMKDALDIDLSSLTKSNSCDLDKNRMEQIRQMLINRAPKFGNDIDEVDDLARLGALIYCREVEKYRNPRGGKFQAGLYPVSINVLFGSLVGATPDGRLAKEPLADGVSPTGGADSNGPTAAINSVAKLDHHIASNGTLLNQKYHPGAIAGDEGLKNLSSLIRNYFDQKGMHVQFNVVDKDTLIRAQKEPEKYKDLVIRVAGYSAQFVALDKSIQDDIINRTEHTF